MIKVIVTIVLSITILYFAGAWVAWDWCWFNPAEWDAAERTLFVAPAVIVPAFVFVGIYMILDTYR